MALLGLFHQNMLDRKEKFQIEHICRREGSRPTPPRMKQGEKAETPDRIGEKRRLSLRLQARLRDDFLNCKTSRVFQTPSESNRRAADVCHVLLILRNPHLSSLSEKFDSVLLRWAAICLQQTSSGPEPNVSFLGKRFAVLACLVSERRCGGDGAF